VIRNVFSWIWFFWLWWCLLRHFAGFCVEIFTYFEYCWLTTKFVFWINVSPNKWFRASFGNLGLFFVNFVAFFIGFIHFKFYDAVSCNVFLQFLTYLVINWNECCFESLSVNLKKRFPKQIGFYCGFGLWKSQSLWFGPVPLSVEKAGEREKDLRRYCCESNVDSMSVSMSVVEVEMKIGVVRLCSLWDMSGL